VTEVLKAYNASHLSEKELLITMGHKKEDMIVRWVLYVASRLRLSTPGSIHGIYIGRVVT
jgi:hypothetical protein